jgi:hypothetical protein
MIRASEIMSEADPSEIVLVDKRRRTGDRLRDVAGVQRALDAVGSAQNITLTALARSRRVLFVEGDGDFRLLRRFARRLGMQELAAGLGIIALPSGGFGSWQRVTTLASGIAEALGASLSIAALYDRDYYCDEQIDEIIGTLSRHLKLAYVHKRKEIENYMLIPDVLDRALDRALTERAGQEFPTPRGETASGILPKITDPMRDLVLSQIMARRWDHLKSAGRDLADINRDTIAWFDLRWNNLADRLAVVPGKEVLRSLRSHLQENLGVSLTDTRIIESMRRDEIPDDLRELLQALDGFRQSAP